MSASDRQRALIYCRVSSPGQEKDGNGLDSQETRCRQYAEIRGYEVAAVFPDVMTGEGDFMNRPGMAALLSFMDAQPDERFIIIFDDLKRLARDRDFHFALRKAIRVRNAEVECLNFRFDDSPEGEFVETIFAAQGQLERKQNARQVKQKMKARMQNGKHGPMKCCGKVWGCRSFCGLDFIKPLSRPFQRKRVSLPIARTQCKEMQEGNYCSKPLHRITFDNDADSNHQNAQTEIGRTPDP